jgi:cytochrome c oxidase cbb3-type subunit 1
MLERERRCKMQAEGVNRRLVKFIWATAIFFAWSLIMGIILSAVTPVREFVHMGWPASMVSGVHTHIGFMGWMSLALMATLYHIVPNISGKSIVWPRLIEWIFWLFTICHAASQILIMIAGIVGGSAFAAGVKGAQLMSIVSSYAMPGGIFCTISAIAGVMFVVQILVSISRRS